MIVTSTERVSVYFPTMCGFDSNATNSFFKRLNLTSYTYIFMAVAISLSRLSKYWIFHLFEINIRLRQLFHSHAHTRRSFEQMPTKWNNNRFSK